MSQCLLNLQSIPTEWKTVAKSVSTKVSMLTKSAEHSDKALAQNTHKQTIAKTVIAKIQPYYAFLPQMLTKC